VAIDRAKKPEEVDVEELLGELESKVERVKILYEQYFMGIEKIEPRTARKEITRKMLEISQMNIRNTALRYRFNALNQKVGVYTTYWNRTIREIEQGTYLRSIARAGREAARRGVDVPDEVLRAMPKLMRERILRDRERIADGQEAREPPKPSPSPSRGDRELDSTIDALFDSLSHPAVTASKPSPLAPPAAPRPYPPGMDEAKMRDLYQRYVQARRAVGGAAGPGDVRYEQLVATVMKQAPKILEQHGAREVDFQVVIKEGKVILKATPRR
jgi:hypothetical protein